MITRKTIVASIVLALTGCVFGPYRPDDIPEELPVAELSELSASETCGTGFRCLYIEEVNGETINRAHKEYHLQPGLTQVSVVLSLMDKKSSKKFVLNFEAKKGKAYEVKSNYMVTSWSPTVIDLETNQVVSSVVAIVGN